MAVLQPEGVNDSSDINPEMYVDKKRKAQCPVFMTG